MIRNILFISFLSILLSCSSEDKKILIPENIIPPEQMVPILVDFHLTEASIYLNQQKHENVGPITIERYNFILKKHKITRKKLDESFRFYSDHINEMEKIYEQVVVELSKAQSGIKN